MQCNWILFTVKTIIFMVLMGKEILMINWMNEGKGGQNMKRANE